MINTSCAGMAPCVCRVLVGCKEAICCPWDSIRTNLAKPSRSFQTSSQDQRVQPSMLSATLSHMEISIRDLRNQTSQVVAAVQAGQRVTLLNRGTPIADIVPHARRSRWIPGGWMAEQLSGRQADAALAEELERDLGQTIDEL